MKTSRIFTAFVLAIVILVSQVGAVFATPALQQSTISGTVQALTCEIDPVTGTKTFFVTVEATDGTSQTAHVSQITAETLELITVNADGIADCSPEALELAIGLDVTILPADILQEEEPKHPVGDALATFFDEITDYETIMTAHDEDGFGFGVIAQALWLLLKIDDAQFTLKMVLDAKQSGDFSDFDELFEADSTPENWGQFRKAVLDGAKKNNLGVVMSDRDKDNANNGGNVQSQGTSNSQSNKNKNKNNEKSNNGNPGNNGNNGDTGNGNEKDKGKNK